MTEELYRNGNYFVIEKKVRKRTLYEIRLDIPQHGYSIKVGTSVSEGVTGLEAAKRACDSGAKEDAERRAKGWHHVSVEVRKAEERTVFLNDTLPPGSKASLRARSSGSRRGRTAKR